MTLYFHENASGPNITTVPVAGIAGKLWSFTQFGTIFVVDIPLTESPEYSAAAVVGRCQGIFVPTAFDESIALVMVSIVFTGKRYKGSTLELQGNSKELEKVQEISVVSGTGMLRLARGYAMFETYYVDTARRYTMLCCNVTLLERY